MNVSTDYKCVIRIAFIEEQHSKLKNNFADSDTFNVMVSAVIFYQHLVQFN